MWSSTFSPLLGGQMDVILFVAFICCTWSTMFYVCNLWFGEIFPFIHLENSVSLLHHTTSYRLNRRPVLLCHRKTGCAYRLHFSMSHVLSGHVLAFTMLLDFLLSTSPFHDIIICIYMRRLSQTTFTIVHVKLLFVECLSIASSTCHVLFLLVLSIMMAPPSIATMKELFFLLVESVYWPPRAYLSKTARVIDPEHGMPTKSSLLFCSNASMIRFA